VPEDDSERVERRKKKKSGNKSRKKMSKVLTDRAKLRKTKK